MESNKVNQKPISKDNNYEKVLKEVKLVHKRSAILRFHRDTDNLDFDGRR